MLSISISKNKLSNILRFWNRSLASNLFPHWFSKEYQILSRPNSLELLMQSKILLTHFLLSKNKHDTRHSMWNGTLAGLPYSGKRNFVMLSYLMCFISSFMTLGLHVHLFLGWAVVLITLFYVHIQLAQRGCFLFVK